MCQISAAKKISFILAGLCVLSVLSGCQDYGKGVRPVVPLGDSTLGVYVRMMRGNHFFSDLGAQDRQRVLVTRVAPGGPADRAGIRPGAIILKINGHRCYDAESTIILVRNLEPGKIARVKVRQVNREEVLSVRVARSYDVWGDTPGNSFIEKAETHFGDLRGNGNKRETDEDEALPIPGIYAD